MRILECENFVDRHLKSNFIKYVMCFLLFFVGVVVGVFYLNNIDNHELNEYVDTLNLELSDVNVNMFTILKQNSIKNFWVFILCGIVSLSIIGVPILICYVVYRGFTLGLTISLLVCTYGKLQGLLFSFILLYFSNIVTLIGIIFLIISSIRFVQNIFWMKKDIRIEITRHFIIVIFFGIMLCISIFLETILAPIATNILI